MNRSIRPVVSSVHVYVYDHDQHTHSKPEGRKERSSQLSFRKAGSVRGVVEVGKVGVKERV